MRRSDYRAPSGKKEAPVRWESDFLKGSVAKSLDLAVIEGQETVDFYAEEDFDLEWY